MIGSLDWHASRNL